MKSIHLIYFSPALSTKNIMHIIGEEAGMPVIEHDITQGSSDELKFYADDLVVFGIPVYSGRVPALAVEALNKVKGKNTPAVAVCVYGNRDYDDALLELKDVCENNGFKVFAAGAFIARHSIFPKIAADRPDNRDKEIIKEFARRCIHQFQSDGEQEKVLQVKGNHPYREVSKIPFVPKGNRKCNSCGACVKKCPTNAISAENPRKTNKEYCIACARCIEICPTHARQFRGILYKLVGKKFLSSYSARREADTFFPS